MTRSRQNRIHLEIGRGEPLTSLPRANKIDLVREHGGVVFRGFQVDTAEFRGTADQVGHRFYDMALDPRIRERVSSDGRVAGVIKGTGAMPPHMERGYSPLRPELVLFHVVQPADVGGDSLLCDGARVLEGLSPSAVSRFRTKRLKYRHTWEPEAWRSRYGATPDDVARLFSTLPDIVEHRFEGELLHYSFVVSAIVRSRLGGDEGFVNNLEGAWELMHSQPEGRRAIHEHFVSFEDDEPLTQTLIDEVHDAVGHATEAIPLEVGDVVVLDNYRVMHGRQSFVGARVMHAIMSDASF